MKLKGLFILIFASQISYGQVSGDIIIDERAITDSISFEIKAYEPGTLVFDISVDINGKVTSCTWNKFESTLNSQRSAYEAKNRILMELKFEPGNGYPTNHQGKVIITSK
ncbi:hypothetical protein N8987_05430 [Crocinitomix sp.]|nr:hypothetical protein [Crocinitomix sp.]